MTSFSRWTVLRFAALALPILYYLALLVQPLLLLLRTSFEIAPPGQVFGEGFFLSNYRQIFTNPVIVEAIVTTLRIGVLTSLCSLLLGYPLALYLSRSVSRWRRPVFFIALSPLLISVVVRSYGWIVLLSDKGPVNSLLVMTGLVHGPVRMIYNEFGVVVGMTHILLPFMLLSLLSVFNSVDHRLEEAAAMLGAKPWRANIDITLPLVLPGAVSGVVLVFILSVGSFITPVLLGGQMVMTLPILALQQFQNTFNWPLGSALAMLLLLLVLGTTVLFERTLRRRLQRGGAA